MRKQRNETTNRGPRFADPATDNLARRARMETLDRLRRELGLSYKQLAGFMGWRCDSIRVYTCYNRNDETVRFSWAFLDRYEDCIREYAAKVQETLNNLETILADRPIP